MLCTMHPDMTDILARDPDKLNLPILVLGGFDGRKGLGCRLKQDTICSVGRETRYQTLML